METQMKSLSEMLNLLHEKGYIHDFEMIDEGLKSKDTNEVFKPGDVVIEKVYRFEGESDPADMAVLYGISSKSGTKGTLIDAYGVYNDVKISNFLKKAEISEGER